MQLVPQEKPSPRLLNTVVPDSFGAGAATPATPDSALGRGALFSGNGLAIFVGLTLGCLLVAGAGWLHQRHIHAQREAPVPPTLLTTSTGSVSSSVHEVATPAPIMVEIGRDQIRVSAISLGHPRLAVINDQQVGEGDFVSVRSTVARVQVRLKVMKIADGRIELSDGTQTIVARLALGPAKPNRS